MLLRYPYCYEKNQKHVFRVEADSSRIRCVDGQALFAGTKIHRRLEKYINQLSNCTVQRDFTMDTSQNAFAGMLEFNSGRISLGGHRGSGANSWCSLGQNNKTAKFRENTISSFLAAVESGATFLEFDVQVTSDGIPIIFHDNYLVFGDEASPTSSLVKNISLSDFKSLAPINSSSDLLYGASDDDTMSTAADIISLGGVSPLYGGSPTGGSPAGGSPRSGPAMSNNNGRLMRMHNNEIPALPFEPSLQPWEVENEDHFPTLFEVFSAIPSHIAFDIEIKMTTPNNLQRTSTEEIERIVHATMDVIKIAEEREAATGVPRRHMMFSSFDPDVCTALKALRPDLVVMFLSGGGAYEHVDPRRTSIQSAIEFAASSLLEGIILETSVLESQQYMVEMATKRSLKVLTYGALNDNPVWVKKQEKLGVHGVIVDDVDVIVDAWTMAYDSDSEDSSVA